MILLYYHQKKKGLVNSRAINGDGCETQKAHINIQKPPPATIARAVTYLSPKSSINSSLRVVCAFVLGVHVTCFGSYLPSTLPIDRRTYYQLYIRPISDQANTIPCCRKRPRVVAYDLAVALPGSKPNSNMPMFLR